MSKLTILLIAPYNHNRINKADIMSMIFFTSQNFRANFVRKIIPGGSQFALFPVGQQRLPVKTGSFKIRFLGFP